MAVVTNVSGTINLSASFTEVVSSGIIASTSGGGSLSLQSLISIADQLTNSTGAAKTCDLMHGKQWSTTGATLFDFSALADPNGTSQNWTSGPGRVRLLMVQNVDTTAGHDLTVYADATNGVAWLPPSTATTLKVRANGGILLIYDPNSNGAGVGEVLSTTSKRFNIDAGANTVAYNVLIVGDSVL